MVTNERVGARYTAIDTLLAYRTVTAATAAAGARGASHNKDTVSTNKNGTMGHTRTPQPTTLDGEMPSRSTNAKIS
jgi:hypothetical protein